MIKTTDTRIRRFLDGLDGKRVTFCGIGRSNAPSAELFAAYGARITVCDRRSKEEMGDMAERMEKNRQELNRQLPAYSQVAALELVENEFEKTPKKSIKRFLYS